MTDRHNQRLHEAIANSDVAAVERALRQGASPTAPHVWPCSALPRDPAPRRFTLADEPLSPVFAVFRYASTVYQYSDERRGEVTRAFPGVRPSDMVPMLNHLHHHGARLDAVDAYGETLWHAWVRHHRTDSVARNESETGPWLLEHGVDIHARSVEKGSVTPLHLALSADTSLWAPAEQLWSWGARIGSLEDPWHALQSWLTSHDSVGTLRTRMDMRQVMPWVRRALMEREQPLDAYGWGQVLHPLSMLGSHPTVLWRVLQDFGLTEETPVSLEGINDPDVHFTWRAYAQQVIQERAPIQSMLSEKYAQDCETIAFMQAWLDHQSLHRIMPAASSPPRLRL